MNDTKKYDLEERLVKFAVMITTLAEKIIQEKPLVKNIDLLMNCYNECNELISIFVKSIQTAETNRNKK